MTWVVTLRYDIDVDAETIVSWGDQLDTLDASLAPEPGGGLSITVWVDEAEDVFDAQRSAHEVAHNVTAHGPIGIEVLTEQAYVATADEPTLPEMVSAPEVGEMLGVTRQRVSQLQHTTGFPEPLYRLRTGPIWDAKAIGAFARVWDRRPGPKSRAS
ncbi:MAG: hypothetical protein L0K86_20380 [Actinomycetia bacterium]|nr:hypothetical protein [Actinomycetes bacterium]